MGVVRTVYKGEVETGVVAWLVMMSPVLVRPSALEAHFGAAQGSIDPYAPKLTQITCRRLQDGEGALCFGHQFVALQHVCFDDQGASSGVNDFGDAQHFAI